MADNVTVPLTGSGDSTAIVATDDIGGGVQIQRMKVAFGVGGTATDVTASDPLPIAAQNPLDYDTGAGTVVQGLVGIALPASGGPVGVSSSNPLPVTSASLPLPSGAATAANQTTEIAGLASIDGKITAVNTGAVVVSSSALPSGASTSAAQTTGNTSLASIDGKITAVNTGAVVVSSSALPSGASTAAKQPALGTAGTASADVITIQGIASMTKLLVTPDSVALPANQSVNVAQINGVTPLMGAGNTGTGSPRVTVATDDINLAAINAVSGTTAGAKVITDANGTIQQYLRGLIYQSITAGASFVQTVLGRIYGGAVTLTTTNFTSLANGSGWQSAAVTTNGKDLHFLILTKGQASGTAVVNFYVAEELSNGSTYTDAATGSEGTFTAANRLNSRFIAGIQMSTTNAVSGAFKLSDVYSVIPAKVSLIGINNSGAAVSTTAGDHVFTYETAA